MVWKRQAEVRLGMGKTAARGDGESVFAMGVACWLLPQNAGVNRDNEWP